MNSPLQFPAAETTLKMFVFYDDFAIGVSAKQLGDRICQLTAEDCAVETDIWKADSIPTIGPLMGMLAAQAMDADILVFATRKTEPDFQMNRRLHQLYLNRRADGRRRLFISIVERRKRSFASDMELTERLVEFSSRTGMTFIQQPVTPRFPDDFQSLPDHLEALLNRPVGPAVAAM